MKHRNSLKNKKKSMINLLLCKYLQNKKGCGVNYGFKQKKKLFFLLKCNMHER